MNRRAVYELDSLQNKDNTENADMISEIADKNAETFPESCHIFQEYNGEFALLNSSNDLQNQRLYKFGTFQSLHIGIYGWRKTTVYILIWFTILLTLSNSFITIWIIFQCGIDSKGFQGIDLSNFEKVIIEKRAFFSNKLITKDILAKDRLKISSKNSALTLISSNSNLTITSGKIIAFTDQFEIKNKHNKNNQSIAHGMLLKSNKNGNDLIFSVYNLSLRDIKSIRVPVQLQTPLIDPGKHDQLNIRSPKGNISIVSKVLTSIQSKFGPTSLIAESQLKIRSILGPITLESIEGIYFRNIPVPNFTSGESFKTAIQNLISPKVYQLCICENGKLFTVHPSSICSIHSNSDCR